MLTSTSPFPLEIFEDIIHQADPDNPETRSLLITLSLVCSSFQEICQKRLFHTLKICLSLSTTTLSESRLPLLRSILQKNPRLSTYVRHLRLFDSRRSYFSRVEWMEELVSVLTELASPSLQLHRVSFGNLSSNQLVWTDLSPLLRTAILNILANPHIKQLGLWRVRVPTWFLGVVTQSIQHLHIFRPNFVRYGDGYEEFPSGQPQNHLQPKRFSLILDRLTVHSDVDTIGNDIALDLSQVTFLEVGIYGNTLSNFNVARLFVLPRITELSLICGYMQSDHPWTDIEPFDLSQLGSLTSLSLECPYPLCFDEAVYRRLKDIISSLPSPHPTLRTIEIKFKFWLTEYSTRIWSDFSELSEVLLTRSDDPRGVLDLVKISLGLSLELQAPPMSAEMQRTHLEKVREEALEKIAWKGEEKVLWFSVFMTEFQESLR
ncbi:hypothetical protein BDN72DRAFT_843595 [Pluteus cervinus]|uniref:Uncharacterized protein n=1 Tax=Pluteus cervinus TaxID=181527 RepID=A0ACD3AM26_9AGAR|nr:hypothetical protein BDN72DRAFT_843595 [Pluteus cervinus]